MNTPSEKDMECSFGCGRMEFERKDDQGYSHYKCKKGHRLVAPPPLKFPFPYGPPI